MIIRKRFLAGQMLFGALILLASGCGGASEGVKVTGSVTKGGKAEEGVKLAFISQDKEKGLSKGAQTDAAGKFEIKLRPGSYSVSFSKWVDNKGNLAKESNDPNEDFAQLEASGKLRQILTAAPVNVEIPAEGKQLAPFDLK